MYKQKTLFFIVTFGSLIFGCSKRATPVEPAVERFTVIGGHVDTILALSESPFRVTNTLIVDSSGRLEIAAGVRIYFEDSTQIIVHGKLSCIGSPTQKILLSSKNKLWQGIQISGTNFSSIIQYAEIENIDVTIPSGTARDGSVEITNANAVIQNSIFRNNKSNNGGALVIDQSQSVVTNNLFVNNYAVGFGGAVLSSSSSNKIINNTFYKNRSDNYAAGLLLISPVLDTVQNNIFYSNTGTYGDPRISFLSTDSSHYVAEYNFLDAGSNPYFVSATDIHLSILSPCINAGNPASQFNDADGTRNDQGAYGGALGNW